MKRLLRNKSRIRICIPIIETTIEMASRAMKRANPYCDLIEIRGDNLRSFELKSLFDQKKKPVIFTNRRREEGGKWKGNEKERFGIIQEAINLGTDYVDLELRSQREELVKIIKNRKNTKVILSYHDFRKTPTIIELQRIFDQAIEFGPDVIKIVIYAKSYVDNLHILSLIPYAKKRSQKVLAFAMGQKGKISRILSPILGAEWTYASLKEGKESAPGQLTIEQMMEVYKILGC